MRPVLTRDEDHVYTEEICGVCHNAWVDTPCGSLERHEGDPVPVSYPSVTTIIDKTVPTPFEQAAAYGHWCAKNGTTPWDYLKECQKRGNAVHGIVERWAKGEALVDTPKIYGGYLLGFSSFLLDHDVEPVATERMTVNREDLYAGTLDLIALVDGRRLMLDVKTSKKVKPDQHFPQLAAYERAEVLLGEEPTEAQVILHLPGDGSYKLVPSTYTYDDFACLLPAFRKWERRQKKS